MKSLQNILVAVDFSESSDYVIENSIRLAEKFNSQITLMHVISEDHLSSKLDNFIEDSVQTRLAKIASDIKAKGVKLKDTIIEHGIPFERIINEAQTNDYNVIVAGSAKETDKRSHKPGTTVEKLMRKNEIPIWVVKPEPLKEIKKILCPVDFSDASHRALNNAITLARKFGADLFILNVYTPVNYASIFYEADDAHENKVLRSKQEHEFHSFIEQLNLENLSYKKVTVEGEVHEEILNYIKKHKIDLLLMGTTGRTGLSRILMGSTTAKVVHELPCNFITTKTKDITDDYFESSIKSIESIIHSAKKSFENKDYNRSIEKYNIGLKQHPDNIPILMGLIESYQALDDKQKVDYYRNYAHKVIVRIWGKKYLNKFKL